MQDYECVFSIRRSERRERTHFLVENKREPCAKKGKLRKVSQRRSFTRVKRHIYTATLVRLIEKLANEGSKKGNSYWVTSHARYKGCCS